MRGFELAHPATLDEAIGMLDTDDDGVRAFAGGTALMLMLKSGLYKPRRFVCLNRLDADLAQIHATAGGGLAVGALVTLATLESCDEVRRRAPAIARAMRRLANPRVRNAATIGGALAHADPHMDLPPVLAALDAVAIVAGPAGERRIDVADLQTGYYETVLRRGELIVAVDLPPRSGWRSHYSKTTTRSAEDWPALGIAASLRIEAGVVRDARIFIAAATEKLTRLTQAEAAVRGQPAGEKSFAASADAAAAEARTTDDPSGSAAYKTALLRVHLARTLAEAAGETP